MLNMIVTKAQPVHFIKVVDQQVTRINMRGAKSGIMNGNKMTGIGTEIYTRWCL